MMKLMSLTVMLVITVMSAHSCNGSGSKSSPLNPANLLDNGLGGLCANQQAVASAAGDPTAQGGFQVPDSDAALTSWGGDTKVTISGNVLIGGKEGLTTSSRDAATTVTRNVMNGPLIVKGPTYQPPGVSAPTPPGWIVRDNRQVDYSPGQGRSLFGGALARAAADAAAARPEGAWTSLCAVLVPDGAAKAGGVSIGADLTCPGPQARR